MKFDRFVHVGVGIGFIGLLYFMVGAFFALANPDVQVLLPGFAERGTACSEVDAERIYTHIIVGFAMECILEPRADTRAKNAPPWSGQILASPDQRKRSTIRLSR